MRILLPAESTVQPGDLLGGRYLVESVLGIGGMGVVVATRHVALNTRFAVKLMRPEAMRDEASVERFLREARAAATLKSEHCVRVLDVGKLENGSPYMVMELLVGKDLGELVHESGARSPAESVDYILQACEGIAEAHSLGLIHRDIKPQNLFLTRGVDGMPLVKVLDFGLAKSMKATPEIRALTHTDAVMGSPVYMSPEQMRASRNMDARSDIWSLAVCLYELLTARTPFNGSTYPELCSMVLNQPPLPMPSDIPRALTRVILRALQKDPRRRYVDVAELAEALEPFASAPGARARIRAVLDAPRPEQESRLAQHVHDPAADTEAGASIDTTTRREREERGVPHAVRRAGVIALGVAGIGVGALAIAIAIAMRASAPSPATAAPDPTPARVVAPPAEAATVPLPPTPSEAFAAEPRAAQTPTANEISTADSTGTRAKGTVVHRGKRAAPPPATAQPKPSAPVFVPKTTEF